jgi:transcriptional regulator with XRE-family HTH domain
VDEDPTRDDPAYYEALGRAIQVARTELGLSRRDLAARTGVSYTYLADIENGRRRPSSSPLLAISRALGMSPSELLARAEVYYTRGTGRPFVATALEEDVGERLERRALTFGPPPEPEEAGLRRSQRPVQPPGQPGYPRGSGGVAYRRTAPEPDRRARRELHELIEELSPSDLRLVLELVRRMTER